MVQDVRRAPRSPRGAAALEFALVAPLLLLLLFGIINWGYMLSFRQAISQAAAEGARSAAVAPSGQTLAVRKASARAAVNAALGSYGVVCATPTTITDPSSSLTYGGGVAGTCTVSDPATCSASTISSRCVKVTLSYDYRTHSLLPGLPIADLVLPRTLSYTTEAEVS